MNPASASARENEAPGATSAPPRRSIWTVAGRTLAFITTLLALSCAAPAAAAPIELGVQDDPLIVRLPSAFGGYGAQRLLAPPRVDAALDALSVDTVRINVPWALAARLRGRVTRFAIWNEPNWWSLLRPHRRAASIYRRLFLRGAAAIRAAD